MNGEPGAAAAGGKGFPPVGPAPGAPKPVSPFAQHKSLSRAFFLGALDQFGAEPVPWGRGAAPVLVCPQMPAALAAPPGPGPPPVCPPAQGSRRPSPPRGGSPPALGRSDPPSPPGRSPPCPRPAGPTGEDRGQRRPPPP